MNKSAVISRTNQLTLDFESGLTERFQSLREVVATDVYRRGLGKTAIDLNKAPGNLSVEISEDPTRHFSVESLEKYIETSGDMTPIHYLCEKFLSDKSAKQSAAMAELTATLASLQPLMKQAGIR
jgi:hypothetical protein